LFAVVVVVVVTVLPLLLLLLLLNKKRHPHKHFPLRWHEKGQPNQQRRQQRWQQLAFVVFLTLSPSFPMA
jgi:hypothetical protein